MSPKTRGILPCILPLHPFEQICFEQIPDLVFKNKVLIVKQPDRLRCASGGERDDAWSIEIEIEGAAQEGRRGLL